MAGNIVLISCSDKKREGGSPFIVQTDPVPWLENDELRRRLFETRRRILKLIKDTKLIDSDKQQGNRGNDPRNAGLVLGPDFGEKNDDGSYLSACYRYSGRFYRTVSLGISEDGVSSDWQDIQSPSQVFILSGLYGLLGPFDPIQEYTCHIADRILCEKTSIREIWRPVLTDIIMKILEASKSARIIDLLSEESYQDAVEWGQIYKKSQCFHRAYKIKAGPETLNNSAFFFKNEIMDGGIMSMSLPHDKYISRPYFDDPEERILFEAKLKCTPKEVVREGINNVIPQLKTIYGSSWECLPLEVRKQIVNSESSYQRNKDLIDYDFTGASIHLSKAIEIWLRNGVLKQLIQTVNDSSVFRDQNDRPIRLEKATLGNISQVLDNMGRKILSRDNPWLLSDAQKAFPLAKTSDYEGLANETKNIAKKYRNGWVHTEPMGRGIYEEFREKAVLYLSKWVDIWKR